MGIGTVQPQARTDGPDFREVGRQFHAVPLHVAAVHLHIGTRERAAGVQHIHRHAVPVGIAHPYLSGLMIHQRCGIVRRREPGGNGHRHIRDGPIGFAELVRVVGDIPPEREGDIGSQERSVQADFRVVVALPAKIRIGRRIIGLGIIDIARVAVRIRDAECQDIPVFFFRVEDVERRQFLGHAPSAVEGEVLGYLPLGVQTGRKGGHAVVRRPADHDLFQPEAGRQIQFRPGQRYREPFFGINRQVVHVGEIRIGTRTVAAGRQERVFIILSLSYVSGSLPLHTRLEDALEPSEMAEPVIFERGAVVQFLGIDDFIGIIGGRKRIGQEITELLVVDRRERGRIGIIRMDVRPLVMVIDVPVQADIGHPGFVEQPDQLEMRGQHVVPDFFELVLEKVRIAFAVHAADVAGEAGFQAEFLMEGLAVVKGKTPAGIGLVRRGKLGCGAGPFAAHIQDSALVAQVEALRHRDFIGAGIHRKSSFDRRAAFLGNDPDETAVQVSVFGRGHTRHHLYRFDILHPQAAGPDTGHLSRRGIPAQTDAVHLYRRSKSRIARQGAAVSQDQLVIGRQVRIEGFPARQQGGDIRHARHLQMIQGISAQDPCGSGRIVRLAGRHPHLVKGQGIHLKGIIHFVPAHGDGNLFFAGYIAQAVYFQQIRTRLDILQQITSVGIGHGPQVILVQPDDGAGNGFSAHGFRHRSAKRNGLCLLGRQRHRQAAKQHGQQESDLAKSSHETRLRWNA